MAPQAQAAADPYAAIATPVQAAADPYATIAAAPVAATAPTLPLNQRIQKSFDDNTTRKPGDSLLKSGLEWTVGNLASPLVHPLQTLDSTAAMLSNNFGTAPTPDGYPVNPIATRIRQAGQEYDEGGLPLAATHVAADVLPLLLGKGIGNRLAPVDLPGLTTPTEAAADRFTKAVKPPAKAAPDFAHDVERHFGDMTDYAQRTNNPLDVAKDYVKAAHGAGDEAIAHYKQQILDPVGYRTQPIPSDYEGIQSEGKPGTATLKDIDNRVTDINAKEKLLRGSGGDLAAKERLLGLGAEKAKLLDILHQSLGDLTGNSPEAIQALRQKGPSLKDMGDMINSTDYSRLVQPGMDTVSGSRLGIASQILNKLRGGPQAVADRAMGKVAKTAPMQPTPLPGINPPPTALPALNTDFLHTNDLELAAQDSAVARERTFAQTRAQIEADKAAAEKAFGTDARAKAAANAQRVGLPPLNPPEYPMPTPDPVAQAALRTRLAQQQAAQDAAAQAQAAADAQAAARQRAFGESARNKAAENSNRR